VLTKPLYFQAVCLVHRVRSSIHTDTTISRERLERRAPTDDLSRFWRSKVKVTAGQCMWWRRHLRRCWGIEFHLL